MFNADIKSKELSGLSVQELTEAENQRLMLICCIIISITALHKDWLLYCQVHCVIVCLLFITFLNVFLSSGYFVATQNLVRSFSASAQREGFSKSCYNTTPFHTVSEPSLGDFSQLSVHTLKQGGGSLCGFGEDSA